MGNLNLIENYFHPSNILDIGANTGGWFRICKEFYPNSNVFSIEANDECEQVLKETNPNYLIRLLTKNNNLYSFYKAKNIFGATGNSIYKELTEHYNEENIEIIEQQGYRLDDVFSALKAEVKIKGKPLGPDNLIDFLNYYHSYYQYVLKKEENDGN